VAAPGEAEVIEKPPMPFCPLSIAFTVLGSVSVTFSTVPLAPVDGLKIVTEGEVLMITGKETTHAMKNKFMSTIPTGFPKLISALPGDRNTSDTTPAQSQSAAAQMVWRQGRVRFAPGRFQRCRLLAEAVGEGVKVGAGVKPESQSQITVAVCAERFSADRWHCCCDCYLLPTGSNRYLGSADGANLRTG
jgi:hypothetical protein